MQIVTTCITALLCLLMKLAPDPIPVLNPTPILRPLHIGDRVPDIVLNQLYNYTSASVPISAFGGKLLLLDFWATYCATCIEKMDHMEQLMKRYPEQLQVLLVSPAGKNDTRQRIHALFERHKNSAGDRFQLPVVVNDTALGTLFPNKYLPHIIWINAAQKVIAITGSEAVTTENISAVLAGKQPAFELKEDYVDFKPREGLFKNGNGGSGNDFLFRTIVTPNVLGIPSSSSMKKDERGMVTRISHANAGLLFLLKQAYDCSLPFGHTDLSKAGSDIDYREKDDQWRVNNSYCYEMVVPPTSFAAAKSLMQRDLQRYFGLSASIDLLLTDCYVLTADTARLGRFKSSGGKSVNHLFESSGKQLRNSPVSTLSNYLDEVLDKPVVNETGYFLNINLQLAVTEPLKVALVNKALADYGLQLEPARRVVPILTIIHESLK